MLTIKIDVLPVILLTLIVMGIILSINLIIFVIKEIIKTRKEKNE